MNPLKPGAAAILLGLLSSSAAAAQGPESPRDRFALFAGCHPIPVEVSVTNAGGPASITEASVERMATSRLRAAGIHAPAGTPSWAMLQVIAYVGAQRVTANMIATVYIIRLRLLKLVYDHLSDPRLEKPGRLSADSLGAALEWVDWAPTWESPQPGIGFYPGRGDGPVAGLIGRMLDEFVDEYLRVNGEACG